QVLDGLLEVVVIRLEDGEIVARLAQLLLDVELPVEFAAPRLLFLLLRVVLGDVLQRLQLLLGRHGRLHAGPRVRVCVRVRPGAGSRAGAWTLLGDGLTEVLARLVEVVVDRVGEEQGANADAGADQDADHAADQPAAAAARRGRHGLRLLARHGRRGRL